MDARTLAVLLLSAVPIVIAAGAMAILFGWGSRDAVVLAAIDALCALVLIEWSLRQWRSIPFTCGRTTDVESLKSRWLAQSVPFLLFTFVNAAIQQAVLDSDRPAAWYAVIAVTAILAVWFRRRIAARNAELQFDALPTDAMATLSLSEALG